MGNKNLIKIIVPLVVLLVGSAVYLFLQIREAGDVWPYNDAPNTLTREVNSLTSEIQGLKKDVAKIKLAEEELEKVKVEYELATRVLPRENTPDQLLAAIRTKAQQAGVIVNRLVPSASRARSSSSRRGRGAQTSFEEWRFTLDIRGSYDQIATFVNNMEEFESGDHERTGSEKRFFRVSEFSILASDNGLGFLHIAKQDDGVGVMGAQSEGGHTCSMLMETFRFTGSE